MAITTDTIPNPFTVVASTGAPINTAVTSSVNITGVSPNTLVPIRSTTGVIWSIDGSNFNSPATVLSNVNGAFTLYVRSTSSSTLGTTVVKTITVGGVVGNWAITTMGADTTPNPFVITPIIGSPLNAVVTSFVNITGVSPNTPISITSSTIQWGTTNGNYTSPSTVISNANGAFTLYLKSNAGSIYGSKTTRTITVGGITGNWDITTNSADVTPNPFTFAPITNAPLNTMVSSSVIISGISPNISLPISASSGVTWSIDGVNFNSPTTALSTTAGIITIHVKTNSSSTLGTSITKSITVGGVTGNWVISTINNDTTPNPFTFTPTTNAPLNSVVTASTIIAGVSPNISVSINASPGVTWGIDGVNFNSPSTVTSNSGGSFTLYIRCTTGSVLGATTTKSIVIGGVTGRWDITTMAVDRTPNPFTFASTTNAPLNTMVSSSAVITGVSPNVSLPISASAGVIWSVDGVNYNSPTTVLSNITGSITIYVKSTSSNTLGTAIVKSVTVGGVTGNWSISTIASDITPDPFTVTAITNVPLNATVSSSVNIKGVSPNASLVVNTSTGVTWSTDGINYNSPNTIIAGTTGTVVLYLRSQSSSLYSTKITKNIVVGGVTGRWDITTMAADITPNAFIVPTVVGAALSTFVSVSVNINGVSPNALIPVSAAPGVTWSTDGVNYNSPANILSNINGAFTLYVKCISSSLPRTLVTKSIIVGGVVGNWNITTK